MPANSQFQNYPPTIWPLSFTLHLAYTQGKGISISTIQAMQSSTNSCWDSSIKIPTMTPPLS